MKTLAQTSDETLAVQYLRALANPVRFRIVQLLGERRECVTGDLVDELPLAQSSVSEHLKVLKDAGIVQGTIDGPYRCYCLEPDAMRFLRDLFDGFTQQACC
jgi:ArsR family transcriptional regulator, arsenate/arsenite/antimonite-responsive transcriptional repressor